MIPNVYLHVSLVALDVAPLDGVEEGRLEDAAAEIVAAELLFSVHTFVLGAMILRRIIILCHPT